ncbi:transposase%2C ISSmi4 [Streptococcus pneumoniae]|uniref:IS66 family insertion sequence element accessory protein TnpB n=2 Tax=Streptococcus pneumoniae TaxID=1313 RepID=UPI0002F2824A|nr:Mobile element protein [Streptococcus pneumoniae]VTQ34654.1 IS66 Orf2 like protein [Haemophilus haemolyticus]CVO15951.1 transposase%2C ISSmi4 [Streptococcus pneumoniae]CVP91103.1 transposase%2C ISSmi4 [Streptococcus pneumoniae]CVR57496.1 transposase%2C ISSmi4 [Streptococcus pneumoniae]
MIIQLSDLGQVHLACGKTDMRQGIDSLAYVVKAHFELDPFSGQVFLFCGGRKDRFKALYWDSQGFWLLYKAKVSGSMAQSSVCFGMKNTRRMPSFRKVSQRIF